MKHQLSSFALRMFAAALAACSSEAGSGAPATVADGHGAAGASASSAPQGANAAGNSGPATSSDVCVPGIAATSQVPRLLNRQYEAVVRDMLGITTVGSTNKTASELLAADFDGPMTPDAWRIYQDVGAQIAHAVMTGPQRSRFISCDPAAAGCLDQVITEFGRRAFRRPLTASEVARFRRLGETQPQGTPEEVAETTLLAFLVSPSFLLLPELTNVQDPSGKGVQLSSHEVATRLSFTIWGSIPDATLDAAADAGQLQTKAQLLAQAQRMLAVQGKSGPLLAAFHRDWVQMNNGNAHWWKVDHDPTRYPLFSSDAKPSLLQELDAFFTDVTFSGGSFKDLLLSNVAFVNRYNAAIYGLDPAQYAATLERVLLDPAQRPGFMTRAGFLSSYANYDATSPILRGAFILIYMLGVNPGPPIPGAAMMRVSGDFPTQRAYVETLTKPSQCTGCHSIINPPGFVMEQYDGIGRLQTRDPRGGAIDATVTTADVDFGAGNIKTTSSALALMQGIARSPKARQMYAQAWVTYAFGRDPNANDRCIVNDLETKLSRDGYRILDLLADLTQADAFRLRARQTP